MSLERSPLIEKQHKRIDKVEMSKMATVKPLFDKQLYIHNKFVIKKWVKRRHFFMDEKNLEELGPTGEFISA